jgi:hypothetical protein
LTTNAKSAAREQLTLIRIFEELLAPGYDGGYDAVRCYARTLGRDYAGETADANVPLSFAPGEAYQFDWSHEIVVMNGVTVTVKVTRVRLCHSPIPPEQLLSALLLQIFYGIRSERRLMEQLDYNLLYCWFVGLASDDPVWNGTTFTKNRERLQQGDVFQMFLTKLLNHPQVKPLLSDEHFSVNGTLIEA